ncbi:hypothetical protein OWV82_017637 [Melia azedarach]|uniref:Uncharacterized protein n=1 Tax=Melia azedarach TaxID=155640 RepID=A0ACC1XJV5_MELAZ|nr:hypothetical protein OWV82_017637 [Melia azedarach]
MQVIHLEESEVLRYTKIRLTSRLPPLEWKWQLEVPVGGLMASNRRNAALSDTLLLQDCISSIHFRFEELDKPSTG